MTSDKIIRKIKKAMPGIVRKATEEQKKVMRTAKKCTNCGGKGYTTEMRGEIGYPDFPGDRGYYTAPTIQKNPCQYCKGTGVKQRGVRVPRVRGV